MRVLIVRLGSIGDIVHAMPMVAALRTGAECAVEVDWLVEEALAPVVRMCAGVGTIVTIRTRTVVGQAGWTGAVARLRARRYDAALDAQGLVKSALLARLSGAARVVGWTRAHLREPLAAVCYTERVDPSGAVHVIDKNLALLSALGVRGASRRVVLEPHGETAASREVVARVGSRFVLVNPGANWPNKRWPAERFGEMAARVRERHALPSVVLWGPGDDAMADAVVAASRGAAVRAPMTTLSDVVALAGQAALVVSGDTGPLHLACAAGAPTVGVFGPTDPRRNGPWAVADESVSRFEACACHHQRACRAARWCLLDVGVDEVVAAVERRLAAAGSLPANG